MAIYCKSCGTENEDGSVLCSKCGNMLVDLFGDESKQAASSDTIVNSTGSGMTQEQENVIPKETVRENIIQQKPENESASVVVEEYLFKIETLAEVEEYVRMKNRLYEDKRITHDERNKILSQLKARCEKSFKTEINDYKDNGTFTSNLKNMLIALIVAIIGGSFMPLIGIISLLVAVYFLWKAFHRLHAGKDAQYSAKVYKTLKRNRLLSDE